MRFLRGMLGTGELTLQHVEMNVTGALKGALDSTVALATGGNGTAAGQSAEGCYENHKLARNNTSLNEHMW